MSFLSRQQRYEFLKAVRQQKFPGMVITKEEERYIRDYAMEQAQDFLKDPEMQAAMDRLYESRWAHRFD